MAIRLVNRLSPDRPSFGLVEFVQFLIAERDRVRAKIMRYRGSFLACAQVRDRAAYHAELFRLHAHLHVSEWGGQWSPKDGPLPFAWEDLRRWYSKELSGSERSAICNSDGGIINILNLITDGLIRERIGIFLRGTIAEYVPSVRQQELRRQFAEELVERYPALIPDDPIYTKEFTMIMLDARPNGLEDAIAGLATRSHRS